MTVHSTTRTERGKSFLNWIVVRSVFCRECVNIAWRGTEERQERDASAHALRFRVLAKLGLSSAI